MNEENLLVGMIASLKELSSGFFRIPFSAIFKTRDGKEPHYLGSGTDLPKLATTYFTRYRPNPPNYCMNDFIKAFESLDSH